MHARLVTGKVHSGKLDEFVTFFREKLGPQVKEDAGFRKAFLLIDPASDTGVALAIYDTEEDVKAAEPRFRERVSSVTSLLSGPPDVKLYEVGAEV